MNDRRFAPFRDVAAIFLLVAVQSLCGSAGAAAAKSGPDRQLALIQCVNPVRNERWPVKTLSDGVAVDSGHPTMTTVQHLSGLTPPAGVTALTAPRSSAETKVYAIHASLQEYRLESDHDFHVVISDFGGSPNNTMIAEIPDSQCDGVSGDGWTAAFDSMRAALESKFGVATTSFIRANAEATITGVLFFDKPHGQTGHAPNYVELHPVLALKFGPAPPAPAPTAAASASPTTAIPHFDSAAAAQNHCPTDVVVWLNTRTTFYHLKGHRYYGATTHGAYVCQKEAKQAGFKEGY